MHDKNSKLPGEAAFTLLLAGVSIGLMLKAYGISGFEALSAPGSFPLAVTGLMVVTALAIAWRTLRQPKSPVILSLREIVPGSVIFMTLMVAAYAVALRPLGFLPTSFLFLVVSIRVLFRARMVFSLWVSALALALIYIVFRLIFSVLMPEGIVPEREIHAFLGNLFTGGAN